MATDSCPWLGLEHRWQAIVCPICGEEIGRGCLRCELVERYKPAPEQHQEHQLPAEPASFERSE